MAFFLQGVKMKIRIQKGDIHREFLKAFAFGILICLFILIMVG